MHFCFDNWQEDSVVPPPRPVLSVYCVLFQGRTLIGLVGAAEVVFSVCGHSTACDWPQV